MPTTTALIVAAGQGLRARAHGERPKQYAPLAGRPVLRWAIEAFVAHPAVSAVRVVIRDADRDDYEAATAGLPLAPPISGGATRQESVRNGLEALAAEAPERVLIHDAARPLVARDLIGRVVAALDQADAAAPLLPVADTLRRRRGEAHEIVDRDDLVRTQTPQGFRFAAILAAHRAYGDESVTDDVALAERAGLSFRGVAGSELNIKVTTAEDFAFAERLARGASETRTASGYDVHRFTRGDHVWLCGIKLPHSAALEGHSDADAGLHALTDALLGAISAGDIGLHFPPSDERWRGAPSHLFLAHAAELVRTQRGEILHVDVTLICERPKIGPHREAMRQRIAEILQIDTARVSVKATTTEGLGFTGRSEGLAAQATATVRLPL